MTTTLHVYDSLNQTKSELRPLKKSKIGIYVCGMTVYDYCHIGHARVLISFDMITRYLRCRGYDVTYVRNITDIDDKIIRRAQENNQDYQSLTQYFIDAMHKDEQLLNIRPPDIEPRATEHIKHMVSMISALMEEAIAYKASNGDVYYDVTRFPTYGQLAHQSLDSLRAGARVDVEQAKRHPLDFVLWKLTKPGEPSWPSPWGDGRPGWHIECSAMATHYLGASLDIHGGGADLQFPHHQNELAQSEAACKAPFVKYWLHVGHVRVNQEKMSKSLGNFFTIREVLKYYSPEVIRYFLLASHYRSPVNYSTDNLNAAQASVARLYNALRYLPEVPAGSVPDANASSAISPHKQAFIDKMDDDFNTPEALAVLFDLAHEIHRLADRGETKQAGQQALALSDMTTILGLLKTPPDVFLQGNSDEQTVAHIESMIAARHQARAEKDWAKADAIRQELKQQGIDIEDDASGRTTWRKIY